MKRFRKGQTIVLVTFFMTILIGFVSLTVDLGLAYIVRLRMQQAADAAALAAVPNLSTPAASQNAGQLFARLNGFQNGVENCNVNVGAPDVVNGTVKVVITQPMRTFFMTFLGISTLPIGAQATARFRTLLPLLVNGNQNPGAGTSQTLSIYGPFADINNGDPYSPRFLPGGGANPNFRPGGYNFTIQFPANYATSTGSPIASIAIFDPDIFQSGTGTTTNFQYDEIRGPPTGVTLNANTNSRGKTVFSLYAPDNTPSVFSDDVLLAQFEADGSNNIIVVNQNGTLVNTNTRPNGHWVTMRNVNVNATGLGPYRVNVESTEGSAENGFDIVAVPPGFINQPLPAQNINTNVNTNTNGNFNFSRGRINFGTSNASNTSGATSALGYLPINFQTNLNVSIPLGTLPATNANLSVHVLKFDTDVGTNANSVHYFDTTGVINNLLGTISNNNEFKQDDISIPGPYAGGSLRAEYDASINDTSVWSSFFDGFVPGQTGRPQLID